MQYPLVTVKILTFRNFNFIKETIDSVFSQDYPNIEMIISDDGSDNFDIDFIYSLIKYKPNNIKSIQLIHHEENLGTVRNLNNCIKISKGEYFIGIASDDCFYSNKSITEVVKFFEETGALIVTSKRAVYDNCMKEQNMVLPFQTDLKYLMNNQDYLYRRLCYSNFISGSSTSYSRKLFEKYGGFDESYFLLEDYPYYIKLSRRGEKIYFFDYITIKYRSGGISNSKKRNEKLLNDSLTIIKKEILPYKNQIGYKLYNLKDFEYDFISANIKNKIIGIIKHPIIFMLKIINKLGIVNIRPEYFVVKLDNK
jgi:GT2 family glycosyltransferase